MRGRAIGQQERMITLAHQTAMFSREKRLRPLKHYLNRRNPAADIGAVLAMFKQLAEQGKATITPVQRRVQHRA